MWRAAFSLALLAGLFVLVPFIAERSRPAGERVAYAFSEPNLLLDVDRLAVESRNRALHTATIDEIHAFRGMRLERMVEVLENGSDRERRVVGALLGADGSSDAVKPLAVQFDAEKDPRTIAALAMALAESRRNEAILVLIDAIRGRHGIAAYEACRALDTVFGVQFGLDADAWDNWLRSTTATRD
jgi:hypothetical protein